MKETMEIRQGLIHRAKSSTHRKSGEFYGSKRWILWIQTVLPQGFKQPIGLWMIHHGNLRGPTPHNATPPKKQGLIKGWHWGGTLRFPWIHIGIFIIPNGESKIKDRFSDFPMMVWQSFWTAGQKTPLVASKLSPQKKKIFDGCWHYSSESLLQTKPIQKLSRHQLECKNQPLK